MAFIPGTAFLDAVADGLIAIDGKGIVLWLNAAAASLFGYTAAVEVIGNDIGMLIPEHYRAAGVECLAGAVWRVEGRRRDGVGFPLEIALSELWDEDRMTYVGAVRDITDRKVVEDSLVESEQRFRDLAESASDWFWETDHTLHFIYVSARIRAVLGLGPEAFLGRAFEDLRPSMRDSGSWNDQRRLMEAHEPFRGFVFIQRSGDGEHKYIEMTGRPVVDGAGSFKGYRGTASDITAQVRQEEGMVAQSSLRQAIIDNMGQGVVVFDARGKLLALNLAARHFLDLPEGTLEPGSASFESFLLCLALQGGSAVGGAAPMVDWADAPAIGAFEHVRPGGSVLEVRATSLPGGGLILTLTDITERKQTEVTLREAKEEAERGHRAKASFLANISHELRTPLNAIVGFSEIMREEMIGPIQPPIYRSYVEDINDAGLHLLDLINDILDMSKAEAGMTDLSCTVVDVAAVLAAAMRMMAHRAELGFVRIVDDIPPGLPRLHADERRLRQIALNILSNAVKFTEEGGMVSVSVRVDEAGFAIVVADTGIGMSDDDLVLVAEPFAQADSRLSRRHDGTGLGLPLTKALVEAHDGRMEIESRPGVGTTVVIMFPPDRVVWT